MEGHTPGIARLTNFKNKFFKITLGVFLLQVDHNGRWKEGAAASLGEEQEQIFSWFSRYGLVTKFMSPACKK